MKLAKRMLALAVAVMLVIVVLVVPASAATAPWPSKFRSFTQTSTYNYQRGYACAVQSILLDHDVAGSYISSAGGVDGYFGTGTVNAVKAFQEDETLGKDGIVGPDTWERMALRMKQSGSGSYTYLGMGYARTAITIIYENSVYNYYYHTTGGSRDSVFRTSY